MRNVFIIMSIAAMFAAMTACTTSEKQAKAAMDEVKMVVEGVFSAKAAYDLGKKYNVNLPIIEQIKN